MPPPDLLPQHRADLRASGLTDATIAACGFRSVIDPAAVARLLGWANPTRATALGPGLAIPFPDPDGRVSGYVRLKPDRPREKDGKRVRYESPVGRPNRAYLPPGTRAVLAGRAVRDQLERDAAVALATWAAGDKDGSPPVAKKVTRAVVSDTLQALAGLVLVPGTVRPPAWLVPAPDLLPATELVAAPNGLIHLPAVVTGRPDALLTPTPGYFNLHRLAFPFDPTAPPPARWLAFLAQLWPDDPASIDCLQEWFGYLLAADTSQQKILMLVGPKRAGKGTIAAVLRGLVGPDHVAGPTLNSLATNFGLWPLLGKPVAVIDNARLSGRSDAVAVTERLLTISGEGAITVDRKHLPPVTAVLPTRFVVITNELPKLGDASGAVVSRVILLRFGRSWYGREDTRLKASLLEELPGILLWAVAGWDRLRRCGRFAQPASGAELVRELEDLASPVGAFVRDRCVTGPGERVEIGELYRGWRGWCDEHGRREPGTEQSFGRDLRAALPSITVRRPRSGGERVREYVGVRLRTAADPPADDANQADAADGVVRDPVRDRSATEPDENPANPGVVRVVREDRELVGDGLDGGDGSPTGAAKAGTADRADRGDRLPPPVFRSDDRPFTLRG